MKTVNEKDRGVRRRTETSANETSTSEGRKSEKKKTEKEELERSAIWRGTASVPLYVTLRLCSSFSEAE